MSSLFSYRKKKEVTGRKNDTCYSEEGSLSACHLAPAPQKLGLPPKSRQGREGWLGETRGQGGFLGGQWLLDFLRCAQPGPKSRAGADLAPEESPKVSETVPSCPDAAPAPTSNQPALPECEAGSRHPLLARALRAPRLTSPRRAFPPGHGAQGGRARWPPCPRAPSPRLASRARLAQLARRSASRSIPLRSPGASASQASSALSGH